MKRTLAILLLAGATALTYAPAVRDGFVWDDTALILRDPLIRSWRLIPEGFNHYLFVDATPSDFYRPLQRLSYTIEYALFTVRPGPYHITNIALHAAAAIALWLLAETVLIAFGCDPIRSRWIAFVGAFIWAIHPVHSAAVAYVSGRADLLAALFGFLACYFVVVSLNRSKRASLLLLLAAGLAFLCSALSKETGVVFPFVAGTLLFLLKQRGSLVRLGLVLTFVAGIYLSLRLPAEHNPPPAFGPNRPPATRPITMARAVAEYAGLLIFPINLHMERDVQAPFTHNLYVDSSALAARELQTIAGIVLLGALLVWGARVRARSPATYAFILSALLAYIPISGVIRLNASVAEHWIYVPSAFLIVAAAAAVAPMVARLDAPAFVRQTGLAVLSVWVLFLGGRTFLRTFDWKDQRTFLERNIAAGGNSARMLINLAALESSENHLELARHHLTEALRQEPDQPFAVLELAAVCIKQSNFSAAKELLGRASKMPLVEAEAHELVAVLENKQNGRADLLRMRLAAHTGYSNWVIEKRYIKLLAETGATAAAIRELQTCLETQWYRAESWQLLAQLLTRTGQAKAAADAMALATSYDVHLAKRPAAL